MYSLNEIIVDGHPRYLYYNLTNINNNINHDTNNNINNIINKDTNNINNDINDNIINNNITNKISKKEGIINNEQLDYMIDTKNNFMEDKITNSE